MVATDFRTLIERWKTKSATLAMALHVVAMGLLQLFWYIFILGYGLTAALGLQQPFSLGRSLGAARIRLTYGWALPARRARHSRVPGLRWRRSRLCIYPEWPDPLLGGGQKRGASKATQRRRDERNAILSVQQQLQTLAKEVAKLSSNRAAAPKPRRRPRGQQSNTSSSTSTSSTSLWNRLQSATAQGQALTDEQLIALFRSLMVEPSVSPAPTTPKPATQPLKKAPSSWAELLRSDNTPKVAASPPKRLHLWQGAWPKPVISAQSLQKHALTEPIVVFCNSAEEFDASQAYIAARSATNITVVTCHASESVELSDSILVEDKYGPVSRPGKIVYTGDHAPQRASLPTAFKDDEEASTATPAAAKADTVVCRLTLAKDFADKGLYERAAKRPATLPSIILGAEAKNILRVTSAAAYATEVTCLVTIRTSWLQNLEGFSFPKGAFGFKHFAAQTAPPQWFVRAEGMSNDAYWSMAIEARTKVQGRLAYRPSHKNSLGIVGATAQAENTILPRWFADKTPREWSTIQATTWATERGFSQVTDFNRLGARSWSFRGLPPTGVCEVQQTFTFKSGITVSKAFRGKPSPKAKTKPTSCWGAPRDVPAKQSDTIDNITHTETVIEVPTGTPQPPKEDADKENAGKRQPDNKSNVTTSKKLKAVASPEPPFEPYFSTEECGGEGDCAPCSVATALKTILGKTSNYTADDLKPKGRLQAQLRTITCLEMENNYTKYGFSSKAAAKTAAKEYAKTGTYADSVFLHALAQASGAELRVWAFDNGAKVWKLYIVAPHTPQSGTPKVVWLRLQAQHYQWLRPGDTPLPDSKLKQWTKAAVYKPDANSLKGAGRKADSDALSCLGIARSVSSRQSKVSARALSCLGIKPNSTASRPSGTRKAGSAASNRAARRRSTASISSDCAILDDVDDTPSFETVRSLHYCCPCGWKPDITLPRTCVQAISHWRRCQGHLPPKASPTARRDVVLRQAAKYRAQNAANAKAKFAVWRANIVKKKVSLEMAICKPNLEVPSDYTGSNPGSSTAYTCTRCGKVDLLSQFKRLPCSKRPASFSHKKFLLLTRGREVMNKEYRRTRDKTKRKTPS